MVETSRISDLAQIFTLDAKFDGEHAAQGLSHVVALESGQNGVFILKKGGLSRFLSDNFTESWEI